MKRRIFIAINLPENIKEKLLEYQNKWLEIPARWAKKDNLHITLVFLGYVNDEELPELIEIVREAVSRHESFSITLNRIIYGPPRKAPRMIWAEGEKNEELGKLQKNLENSLLNIEINQLKEEKSRPYTCHITLGRIRQWEFRQIEPEEKPEIDEDISLNFEVNSIEIMESELKRGGAEYTVLESVPLGS